MSGETPLDDTRAFSPLLSAVAVVLAACGRERLRASVRLSLSSSSLELLPLLELLLLLLLLLELELELLLLLANIDNFDALTGVGCTAFAAVDVRRLRRSAAAAAVADVAAVAAVVFVSEDLPDARCAADILLRLADEVEVVGVNCRLLVTGVVLTVAAGVLLRRDLFVRGVFT